MRFIYAHAPRWYQAVDLEERRDVIEYPIVDDIDLNGFHGTNERLSVDNLGRMIKGYAQILMAMCS